MGRMGFLAMTLTVAVLLSAGLRAEGAPQLGPLRWSMVELEAQKLLMTATARVAVSLVGEGCAAADLPTGLRIDRDRLACLELRSRSLGKQRDQRVLFDAGTGATDWQARLEAGSKPSHKTTRFTAGGVTVERRSPGDAAERALDWRRWSSVRNDLEPLPPERAALPLADPAVLLYLAGTAPLAQPGDQIVVPVYTDRRVAAAVLRCEGTSELAVDYQLTGGSGTERRRARVEVLRVSLSSTPWPGDEAGAGETLELKLLGLEGDIELYLDPALRLPLQVSGRIKPVGRVDVKLRAATLRPTPGTAPTTAGH